MRFFAAYRGVLEVREARTLIGAAAASQIGDWLYTTALLGQVFAATHSAGWVAAATLCRLLPYVALGHVAGTIADRTSRRTILVVGSLARAGLMLCLAALAAGREPIALTLAVVSLTSAAGVVERPAALSLLPRLVGEARLGHANALLHTVEDLAVVVGPAIGAILFALGSVTMVYLVNAATFAVSALLAARLGRQRPRPTGGHVEATGSVAGIRAVRATRFVLPLFLLAGMIELADGALCVQLVLYAERALHRGPGGYGLLLAAQGVGGLASALVNGHLAMSRRLTLVAVGSAVAMCGSLLAYAGTSLLVPALAVTIVAGAALVCCEVVCETVLVRVTPREMLGRTAGLFEASSVAAMAAGTLLASVLVRATSLTASFWIIGGTTVTVSLAVVLGLRGLDGESRKRKDALASRLRIVERLPIMDGTPPLVLEQLASSSQLCTFPAGIDVVVQGSAAHTFYAIVAGTVAVRRDGALRAHMGPGESFGERGLLDNAPRNATVTTEAETELLVVDGHALLDALEWAPMLTTALNQSKAGRGHVEVGAGPIALVDDPRWAPPPT